MCFSEFYNYMTEKKIFEFNCSDDNHIFGIDLRDESLDVERPIFKCSYRFRFTFKRTYLKKYDKHMKIMTSNLDTYRPGSEAYTFRQDHRLLLIVPYIHITIYFYDKNEAMKYIQLINDTEKFEALFRLDGLPDMLDEFNSTDILKDITKAKLYELHELKVLKKRPNYHKELEELEEKVSKNEMNEGEFLNKCKELQTNIEQKRILII